MIKKILIGLAISTLAGAGISAAQEIGSLMPDLVAKSPVYLMVEMGNPGVGKDQTYTGSIEAVGGQITVAKEILIDSSETLTNENGDTGVPGSKIYFSFSTPFYKGLILKVFPDAHFVESASSMGKLIFREKINGVNQDVFEFQFSDLLSRSAISAGDYRINQLYFDKMEDLDQRNETFKVKLAVAEELQNVMRWARAAVLDGKIDEGLYGKFDKMAESGWQVENRQKAYFDWRIARLKKAFNDGKASPALFYGGLQMLMKKMLPS